MCCVCYHNKKKEFFIKFFLKAQQNYNSQKEFLFFLFKEIVYQYKVPEIQNFRWCLVVVVVVVVRSQLSSSLR